MIAYKKIEVCLFNTINKFIFYTNIVQIISFLVSVDLDLSRILFFKEVRGLKVSLSLL